MTEPKHSGGFVGRSNAQIGLSIFALLVAVYSLTYSGTFITDDEHILASRSLSLAFDGGFNDLRVSGNSRVYELARPPAVYAAQGTNIEPAQAVFALPLARLSVLFGAGRVQTIFLLNILATALTAVLVYFIILRLGHPRSMAALTAMIFGLASMAWPYTRTYFRDPLAMLLLTGAWAAALAGSGPGEAAPPAWRTRLAYAFSLTALVAGVLAKNTVLLSAPVLVLYVLLRNRVTDVKDSHADLPKHRGRRIVVWSAALLSVLVLGIALVPAEGVFARFALPYYRAVVAAMFSRPHAHFFEALAGPILSPGKSLFLYSPVLFLSGISLLKRSGLAWPAWSYTFLLIAAQALFYDADWPGHINWGLRYLLPALPLLTIASAPTIERWITTARGRLSLAGLCSISVLVQLAGMLAPVQRYYQALAAAQPSVTESAAIWSVRSSALAWHLKWILSGGEADLAIVRAGAEAAPVATASLLVFALIAVAWTRPGRRRIPWMAFVASLAALALVPISYRNDPAYFRGRADLQNAYAVIRERALPNDIVIVKSYATPAWHYWMNWAGPELRWTSLPFSFPDPAALENYRATNDPEAALDKIALSLLEDVGRSYQRVWLLLPGDSPGAELGLEINWLNQRSIALNSWFFPQGGLQTRLYLFDFRRAWRAQSE